MTRLPKLKAYTSFFTTQVELNYLRVRVHICSDPSSPSTSDDMAAVKTIYDISAKLLTGELLNFSSLKGKVVLIENVASL